MANYIAPVKVYAGEFEMEALAAGALRVLTGQEQPKTYIGIPVSNGFKNTLRECLRPCIPVINVWTYVQLTHTVGNRGGGSSCG